jgi:pimeloyl-ACP methyl ester carboxylesterase
MEKIISRDGTQLAYHRRGAGPPLILVHGSGGSNPVIGWTAVVPAFEEHFTVYAVDRRGYGESEDGPAYAIEREFEDIAAVVDAAGQPAHLLGHSFGALCALGAALLTGNLRRLILYEPAIAFRGMALYPEGTIERLQALLEADDRETILSVIFREVAMMPPHEFEMLRSAPTWPMRIARAHLLVREAREEESYVFDAERFRSLSISTLLLSGGDSPQFLKTITEAVYAALPNSRVAVMPGQQHLAMLTAPDLFLREVMAFLAEPE